MKREDFEEVTEEHFDTCKQIIKDKGNCHFIDCDTCPFYEPNGQKHCCHAGDSNEELVDKCWEFLEMEGE